MPDEDKRLAELHRLTGASVGHCIELIGHTAALRVALGQGKEEIAKTLQADVARDRRALRVIGARIVQLVDELENESLPKTN